MARARELLASGVDETSLDAVGRLLIESSREAGFVRDAEMKSLHGSESSFTILQSDADGLTLMLSRFSPDAATPVHDHKSWGVACVVRGRDRYTHWELMPDGNWSKVSSVGTVNAQSRLADVARSRARPISALSPARLSSGIVPAEPLRRDA